MVITNNDRVATFKCLNQRLLIPDTFAALAESKESCELKRCIFFVTIVLVYHVE